MSGGLSSWVPVTDAQGQMECLVVVLNVMIVTDSSL